MDRLIIRKLDLPLNIRSTTIYDSEGDYNIYLNSRYSADEQARQFRLQTLRIKRGQVFSLESLLAMSGEDSYADTQ